MNIIILDFCRKLSKKEKEHNDDSLSSSDEEFKQPFHHPFLVKERPNIVMNIRVSKTQCNGDVFIIPSPY